MHPGCRLCTQVAGLCMQAPAAARAARGCGCLAGAWPQDGYLHAQRRWNRRLWRGLARAAQGRGWAPSGPASPSRGAGPPSASRDAMRRRRSRAQALPRGTSGHAGLRRMPVAEHGTSRITASNGMPSHLEAQGCSLGAQGCSRDAWGCKLTCLTSHAGASHRPCTHARLAAQPAAAPPPAVRRGGGRGEGVKHTGWHTLQNVGVGLG